MRQPYTYICTLYFDSPSREREIINESLTVPVEYTEILYDNLLSDAAILRI